MLAAFHGTGKKGLTPHSGLLAHLLSKVGLGARVPGGSNTTEPEDMGQEP